MIVVHKLDLFFRDRYDSAFYKQELRKNGVQLYSVLENLDESLESVIMKSVLEGMAEYYSKNLAREVRKGMHENAMKCLHTGGRPAFGYQVYSGTKNSLYAILTNDKSAGNGVPFEQLSLERRTPDCCVVIRSPAGLPQSS